jgi:H+-transporting ATPase
MLDVRKSPDGSPPWPDSADGLTSVEARERRQRFGPNAVAEKAPSRGRVFVSKFWAPVPWMLEAALVLQLALRSYVEAGLFAALLVFNAALSVIQEGRAGAALAALKKRLAPTALARRDGEWVRLPAAEIVPGDVVRLALGALVPADARIVEGSVLIDQSLITGESVPVEASAGSRVYSGSLVRRGQASAEVTATGARTSLGRAVELVRVSRAPSTEQAAIFATTRNLALVNATIALLMLAYAFAGSLAAVDLVRLALTALLATIPLALPTTFTLSAAFSAQLLARRGVLLTRLSAAHEAAAMDVLCADKTGTLTRNALEVVDVVALPGFDRARVLALAAAASSEGDADPIDAAVRGAAAAEGVRALEVLRFVPFDPAAKRAEAEATQAGTPLRIVKGAFEALGEAKRPAGSERKVEEMAAAGHRVIGVAAGTDGRFELAGLVAVSDPPRPDSAPLVAELRALGVSTKMVTGDSPVTAAAIARKVGIDAAAVFARVVPEDKHRLVTSLQREGHIVGMCGDGTNDAPALRQAQIGIAVSRATDAAKAAAGMVLTTPGLGGIQAAVREGRVGFQRLLTYTFNMLVKKIEIVLFLAVGLVVLGQPLLTPTLMVFMLMTNDFLAMSLTTDRATPRRSPARWEMGKVTRAAIVLAAGKLAFSLAVVAFGKWSLGLRPQELQTLALVTLVYGAQALLFVLRERARFWSSRPGRWVLASSSADVAIVSMLALSGTLMAPLPWHVLAALLAAVIAFALLLDQLKIAVLRAFHL